MKRRTNFADGNDRKRVMSREMRPAGGALPPKKEDAQRYLQRVQAKFGDQPEVYGQFLETMKEFNAAVIDTDGVIRRVKTLFRGHRELILGFNQFLPPGYKIETTDLDEEYGVQHHAAAAESEPSYAIPPRGQRRVGRPDGRRRENRPRDDEQSPVKPMEFGHAVNYVTKIKDRFAHRVEVYEEFLDILHTYQENRSIEQVYSRVQVLFADQPDLLDEFAFFLPHDGSGGAMSPRRGPRRSGHTPSRHSASKMSRSRQPMDPNKLLVTYPAGSEKEIHIIERIRSTVPRGLYLQLLKCMFLFSVDIVSRAEFVAVIEDVLADPYTDLAERLKLAIGYNEDAEVERMRRLRSNYYTFVADLDFKSCKVVTPSYRELPPELPTAPCSGRTPLCESVLNDRWVTLPSGTEDQSFKITRKNQYEDALFKCEDERYELDMVIQNNTSTLKWLDSVKLHLDSLSPADRQKFQLRPTKKTPLNVLHLRSIARVYGDAATEMIELLKTSPAVVVPILTARLFQKDTEWRKVRLDMKRTWRDVCEKNFNKSLDHRSFYFKQEDRKKMAPRALVAELRDAHDKQLATPSAVVGTEPVFALKARMPDESLHEEVWQTVNLVAKTKLSAAEQMMLTEFWLAFVVPFFQLGANMPIDDMLAQLSSLQVQCEEQRQAAAVAVPVAASTAPAMAVEEESSLPSINASSTAAARAKRSANAKAKREAAALLVNEDKADEEPEEETQTAAEQVLKAKAARERDRRERERRAKETKQKEQREKARQRAGAASNMGDEEEEDEEETHDDMKRAGARNGATGAQALLSTEASSLAALLAIAKVGAGAANHFNNNASWTPAKVAAVTVERLSSLHESVLADIMSAAHRSASDSASTDGPLATAAASIFASPLNQQLRPAHVDLKCAPGAGMIAPSAFYVFCRLYQALYDRLQRAHELAQLRGKASSLVNPQAAAPVVNTTADLDAEKAEAEQTYTLFARLLTELIEGQIDQSKFEDDCRLAMGAGSFVLFTLDKIALQMTKQLDHMLRSDVGASSLALYAKEQLNLQSLAQQHGGVVPSDILSTHAKNYEAAACRLLAEDSAACAVQLHFVPAERELCMSFVDLRVHVENALPPSEWEVLVQSYMHAKTTVAPPFLTPAGGFAPQAGAVMQSNQLITTIDSKTLKVDYVADTEDVFIRFVAPAPAAGAQLDLSSDAPSTLKSCKDGFASWLTNTVAGMKPTSAIKLKASSPRADQAAGQRSSRLRGQEGGDAATLLASFGEQDDQDDSESDQESGSASGSQSGSESGSEVDERDGESDEELDEELDGEEPLSGDDAQPDEYSDADDAESQPDQMEQ